MFLDINYTWFCCKSPVELENLCEKPRELLPTPQTGTIGEFAAALLNAGPRTDFDASFDINTTAAFYNTVLFLELLDAGNKRGNMKGVTSQVITIASGGGYRRDDKVFSVPYTLSKAAAIHLGKLLANYLKDWQIRSNVIAPGIFPSGASRLLCDRCRRSADVFVQRW